MRTATMKLKKFQTDFIFALISRHFIGLSRYFRLWKVMPQIKEPVAHKFNKIDLKIQEIFLPNSEKINVIDFLVKFRYVEKMSDFQI